MPQLVGRKCVHCDARINDELESHFCTACRQPVHNACVLKNGQKEPNQCQLCGARIPIEDHDAWANRIEKKTSRPLPVNDAPYPVSFYCPQCMGMAYRRVKPATFVAFKWDRVCKECNIRYTPPTPQWAAALFIVVGLILAIMGFGTMLFRLIRQNNILGLPAMACEGFLGILGSLAIIHGIRSIRHPEKK